MTFSEFSLSAYFLRFDGSVIDGRCYVMVVRRVMMQVLAIMR
jgi:hypothetical protein